MSNDGMYICTTAATSRNVQNNEITLELYYVQAARFGTKVKNGFVWA